MAKPELVRKQHVVSKFYLKGFVDSSNRLRRTVLPGTVSHLISADKATVITDYYSLTMEDGAVSDFFERAFSKIEGPASAVHKSVVKDDHWPLTAEEKSNFSAWVALQYLRSEGVRSQGLEMEALIIRLMVGTSGKAALRNHIEKAERQPISEARLDFEWSELTRKGGPRLKPEATGHLQTVTEFLDPTAAMLQSRQWILVEFHRKALVTGDHPVALQRDPESPPNSGIGLATAAAWVLPLSRRHALIIGSSFELSDDRYTGNARLANSINQSTLLNARKCLYFHPEDQQAIAGLHVPEPRTYEMKHSGDDHFIKEEGVFGHLSAEELNSLPIPISSDDENSFSFSDLGWPIKGRVVTWAEPEL